MATACGPEIADKYENWNRIITLVHYGGKELCSDIIHLQEGLPTDGNLLYNALSAKRAEFVRLLNRHVIRQNQFDLIFPPNQITDTSEFDIPLYTFVISVMFGRKYQNVIDELRKWRNEEFHKGNVDYTEAEFEQRWDEFTTFLKDNGYDISKVKDLKTCPLDKKSRYWKACLEAKTFRNSLGIEENKQNIVKTQQEVGVLGDRVVNLELQGNEMRQSSMHIRIDGRELENLPSHSRCLSNLRDVFTINLTLSPGDYRIEIPYYNNQSEENSQSFEVGITIANPPNNPHPEHLSNPESPETLTVMSNLFNYIINVIFETLGMAVRFYINDLGRGSIKMGVSVYTLQGEFKQFTQEVELSILKIIKEETALFFNSACEVSKELIKHERNKSYADLFVLVSSTKPEVHPKIELNKDLIIQGFFKRLTKDQRENNEDENKNESHHVWRSIKEGVVIEIDLEEGDTVVSEVFYSDKQKNKLKIDHKTAARLGGKPNYQTHSVDSTISLKIENLEDGDYIIEIHTKDIHTINVSVNKIFDNPTHKIEEIGIATPGSNIKEYWEELDKVILDPAMREDSKVKFMYSNGASSMTKTQKLKEFEEFGAKYFKDNFMNENLVIFPPYETIIDKYEQSVVNCFIKILKKRYTAERKGVVLVGPNISHLSGIINNTSSVKENINYSKRKCLLVFVEKISLVLVVGIAMEKSDMREEIASVQNDIKCFIKIHSHRIKEGLTIAGIIVCPSVERKVLTNLVPFQFADVDMELYETTFLCKNNIKTERTFIKWWNKSISILNRRLDIPDKASRGVNFINVIGQHMVSMVTITDSLPTLLCNAHDKLTTLILNKEQLTAINSPSTKKHIVGPFGSGKSLVGQTILKNLMEKLKHNGEPSTLFYISCDNNSVVDCHVKNSVEMLSDDTVQLVCGSLNELYGEYINRQHSSFPASLDNLMKGLAEKFPNPHFICDEVQTSVMTKHVAKAIDGYLRTVLQRSHVVFIQQSMTKEREYQQQSIEADNFHLINGLERHCLQKVMRVAVDIRKLIFSAQEVIASQKSTVRVQKPESNTLPKPSRVQREMNPTISGQPGEISEEKNISNDVDENSESVEKRTNSTFEDLDASLKILSRSPHNKTTKTAFTTKTTFFQGQEGNKIFSKKPLLIFLPETNDVDTVKILSFVLDDRCMEKTPVLIANSLQSAKLLNHGAKVCAMETVVYIPYLQRKTPTTGQKNMVIKKDADSVLITDHKSFLGMEHEVVVSIVDPAEKIMRHSIVEIISRCTSYLYLFVLPQKGEKAAPRSMDEIITKWLREKAAPLSMGEIITKWLRDDLVDTMYVEIGMNEDECEPFKIDEKEKKFIIYTKSEEFKSLSDEINCFSDAEFREQLTDVEMSKSFDNILRKVEGNEEVQRIIHEVTYDGKKWSFDDVLDLLHFKHYTTFREMFNHNRINNINHNILNNMRDEYNKGTFLINASWRNRVHVVEHLIHEFADYIDVWAVDENGWNAYHDAAKNDNVDIMKHLLTFDRSGVDVKDNSGYTPLHWAAMYNNMHIVMLLLDAGASVDVVDNERLTPDLCTDDVEIKKIIEDHRTKSFS